MRQGRGSYPQRGQRIYPRHFIFNSCPLPPHTWYNPRVTPNTQGPPPRIVKAVSLIMHSPLLSIHFYHTIILPCSTDITLSFNACLTQSVLFVAFLPTSQLSHWIILFSLPTSFPFPPMCPNYLNTHCYAPPTNTNSSLHLLSSHLAHTHYSTHTPHLHYI